MSQYKKCEWCGGHLDHGERCDCQKHAEEKEKKDSPKESKHAAKYSA